MKHTPKFLLLAVAVIGITACSKKNDAKPSSNIVGKWNEISDTTKNYTNGTLTETDAEPVTGDYAQFNSDGSGTTSAGGSITKFNYTISGSTLTIKVPTQIIDGMTVDATTENYAIKTLTSSQMYLFSDDSETDAGIVYRMTEATHFTK